MNKAEVYFVGEGLALSDPAEEVAESGAGEAEGGGGG